MRDKPDANFPTSDIWQSYRSRKLGRSGFFVAYRSLMKSFRKVQVQHDVDQFWPYHVVQDSGLYFV